MAKELEERKQIRSLSKGDSVCFPIEKLSSIRQAVYRETTRLKVDRVIEPKTRAFSTTCVNDYIRVTREY